MMKPGYKTCARVAHPLQDCAPVETLGGWQLVKGQEYEKTKEFTPAAMTYLMQKEIDHLIRSGAIPKIRYGISVERSRPVPSYKITIVDFAGPLLEDFDASETEWIHVDTRFGQTILSDAACATIEQLLQLLWRYNADKVSPNGIYGHTHFTYQIIFATPLIEARAMQLAAALNGGKRHRVYHAA